MLISKDIKLNIEEEENVKLITKPEKLLFIWIKINMTDQNIDYVLD